MVSKIDTDPSTVALIHIDRLSSLSCCVDPGSQALDPCLTFLSLSRPFFVSFPSTMVSERLAEFGRRLVLSVLRARVHLFLGPF